MSKIIESVFFVESELPQQCDLCGEIEELRPYGPDGAAICMQCGLLDWEATMGRLDALVKSKGVTKYHAYE